MPRQRTKPRRLSEMEMKAFAKAICRTKGIGVDCGTFLEAVVENFGGLKHMATDFFKEYQLAKNGSMQRQRFLELISRLMIYETGRRQSNPTPVGQMEEEDLDVIIAGYMERMGDANGPSAAPAAAAVQEQAPADPVAGPDARERSAG